MKMKILVMLAAVTTLVACNSEKQIEAWVEKNPDKIMKALMDHQRKMQEDNQPKPTMVKENEGELFSASSPTLGSGPVKIAYFFDFNCGHCARQSETNKEVLKSGKVQIFYKNLPVLGPSSELSARAALAASMQNKWNEFYEELYKTREKTPDTLKAIAKKLKLDVAKWEKDMESEQVKGELEKNHELAQKMKISGTPFLAIAPDKVFPGRVDQLDEVVKSIQ